MEDLPSLVGIENKEMLLEEASDKSSSHPVLPVFSLSYAIPFRKARNSTFLLQSVIWRQNEAGGAVGMLELDARER